MKRVLSRVVALAAVGILGTLLLSAGPALARSSVSAVTGDECVPDPNTLAPLHGHNGKGNGNGGHNSPTGISGDNIDDPHSGKVDCLGDGDSGQGNDSTTCCDANQCCNVP